MVFEKLGVKFVEIIRLLNLVAKWMDNLVTKLGEQFSWTFMPKIWWKVGQKLGGIIGTVK